MTLADRRRAPATEPTAKQPFSRPADGRMNEWPFGSLLGLNGEWTHFHSFIAPSSFHRSSSEDWDNEPKLEMKDDNG